MKDKNLVQIYVYLHGEGTDVWRPVNAIQVSENVYQIVSSNSFEDEEWQFQSGELVCCKERMFSNNETHLVAYERVLDKISK